jgi:hypothetical protein
MKSRKGIVTTPLRPKPGKPQLQIIVRDVTGKGHRLPEPMPVGTKVTIEFTQPTKFTVEAKRA